MTPKRRSYFLISYLYLPMRLRLVLALGVALAWAQAPQPLAILDSMLQRTGRLKTLRYELKKYERIRGKLLLEHMRFKLRREPFSVYGYQYSPRKGVEVLFPAEKGSARILAKPNTFPYVAITLDPYSDLVLEDQHQTIYAVGFDRVRTLLLAARSKYQDKLPQLVRYDGALTWDGRRCHKLVLQPPAYQITSYTATGSENIFQIAEKLQVNWYKILELNGLKSANTVPKAGQVLKVPSDYGKVIRLIIDAEWYIPLVVEVEDELGVYERYEYYKVEIDPPLTDRDFSRNNPEYKF